MVLYFGFVVRVIFKSMSAFSGVPAFFIGLTDELIGRRYFAIGIEQALNLLRGIQVKWCYKIVFIHVGE